MQLSHTPSRFDGPAFVASFGVGLLGALALAVMGHHPNDDAYILFRHVSHVAEHFALRWNLVGDPELGTHALYTLSLGLVSWLSGSADIPALAQIFNIALLFVCGPLFYLVARDLVDNPLVALATSLVICLASYNIRIYSQGFEALSFVVVFFWCARSFLHGRYELAILLASLAPLIRPEGIWLSVIGAIVLLSRRVFRWRFVPLYGAIPLSWLAFSIPYYGHFLPQSMQAKQADMILRPVIPLGATLADRLSAGWEGLHGIWHVLLKPVLLTNGEAGVAMMQDLPYKAGNFFLSGGDAIFYAMVIVLIVALIRLHMTGDWLRVLYYSYTIFLAVFIVYTIRLEFWYVPIFLCSALLLIVTGFYHLFTGIGEFVSSRDFALGARWPGVSALVASLLVALLMLGKNNYVLNTGERAFDEVRGAVYVPAHRDFVEFERYFGYRRAAEILNERPAGMAMANEIGVFGYYYKGSVLDTFGLCSKATVEVLIEAHETGRNYPQLLVQRLSPEYVMGGRFEDYYPSMYSKEGYRLIHTDPEYTVFTHPLDIWERASAVPQ